MSARFPRFGRMRRDFEAMRKVVIAAYWLIVAIDSDDSKDKEAWLHRNLKALRDALSHFNEESTERPPKILPDLHGIVLTPPPPRGGPC